MNDKTRGKGPRSGFSQTMYVDQGLALAFKCGICFGIMNDPKQCKKGHAYCGGCFEFSLKDCLKCPSCRMRVIPDDLATCLVVNNIIKDLTVHCKCLEDDHARPGCKWTGTLEQRDLRDCPHLYGDCEFPGCDAKGIHMTKIASHKARCRRRPIMCDDCHSSFPVAEELTHAGVCPARIIECECGNEIHFIDLAYHKRKCGLTLIPCQIYQEYGFCIAGCNGTVQKRHARTHLGVDSADLITAMHARYLKLKVVISVRLVRC